MHRFDVIALGETMIRLSPPGRGRLEDVTALDLCVGGSESNTAVALAQLGRRASWWSRLTEDPLGRRIESELRRWGVDTSGVVWAQGERTGVYFVERGSAPRPYRVHYDRVFSAASGMTPEAMDWARLGGARHFHTTGITAALSDSCAAVVATAVTEARARGLGVSVDVNFRRKLWTPAQARTVLTPILRQIELVLCTAADALVIFGFDGSLGDVANAFQREFSVGAAVVTGGMAGAVALEGNTLHTADAIPSVEVDRVGGGDAFDAGVLDGYLDGDLERGLRFGVAMAALKYTQPGDMLLSTRAEVEAVAAGVRAGIER